MRIELSKTTLRLVAVAFILLSATQRSPVVAAVMASIAILFVMWSMVSNLPLTSGSEVNWAAIAALILVTGTVGRPIGSFPEFLVEYRLPLITLGTLACVTASLWGDRPAGRRVVVVVALLVGVSVVAMSTWFDWSSPLRSDVYHAHRSAGDALASGDNPYTDAVTFADGNPFSPSDRMIEGYPYPPVALSTYGLVGAFTDPRLISAICWFGFLGWLAFGAWKTKNDEDSRIKLSVLMLMALAPLAAEVWYMAWTEPLTLALFLVAALIWNRSHLWAGVFLGLALASKQYLIFLLPLVLLHRDQSWRRRSTAAVVSAGLTLIAGLLPNPTAFVEATIGNLTSIGFRPDTQSLPGLANELGFALLLPNWLWILLSVVIVAALARSSRTRSGFMLRAGLGLGIAFLLGMAFPNYWFLVAGLLAIGTVLEAVDQGAMNPDQGHMVHPSQGRREETKIAGV